MLVGKRLFEIFPRLVGQRLRVPSSARIGEVPCRENQSVGGCYNLIWGVWDSSGVGEVDGHFNLVDDRFKRLIKIVRRGHPGGVILQVCGGNILVISLEVINHLKATYIPLGIVFGFECALVYLVYIYKDLELQGLVNVAVQPEDGGLPVELVPDD